MQLTEGQSIDLTSDEVLGIKHQTDPTFQTSNGKVPVTKLSKEVELL